MKRQELKDIYFSELTTYFLSIGFKEQQIITMNDITAGDYLVANPQSSGLPRFLCLLNVSNILKVECGQIKENNYKLIENMFSLQFLTTSIISDYTIIDEFSGYILDEHDSIIENLNYDHVKFKIDENLEETEVFKFEFSCEYQITKKTVPKLESKKEKSEEEKILRFMISKNRTIRSKQLLEEFPSWTPKIALNKLKHLVKSNKVKQSGSWFKLK